MSVICFMGALFGVVAAWRRSTRPGMIVHAMADIWGGWPGWAHSGAARAGMLSFTESAACEWGASGVRVNAVAPTYVRTQLTAPLFENPEMADRILALTPLKRLAEPEDVAAAIAFLASRAAGMITGHVLPVDGGFLAQ